MKPVTQTIIGRGPKFGEECGNCLQAALASVLELPLEEVPHFCFDATEDDADSRWFVTMNAWLRERFGLSVVYLTIGNSWKPEGYHLMSGTSPRGSMHETVGFKGEIVHDPHPAGGGVSGDILVGIFYVSDPAKHAGAMKVAA